MLRRGEDGPHRQGKLAKAAATAAACLLCCATAQTVVCPSKLAAGEVHTCFVSGSQAASLTLFTSGDAPSTVASGVASSASPGLFTLAVPSDAALGSYFVEAAFPSDGSTKKAAVEVTGPTALVLLEADKMMYKPGQTAQFRALAVRPADVKPLPERLVQFTVTSPNGFKLLQAEASTDSFGVARFDFPIASEPLMGPHKAAATVVAASGDAAVHEITFSVEEYVLPRFEVNLTVDQTHLMAPSWQDEGPDTSTITGHLSATYTYGEGVSGKASFTIMRKLMSWESVPMDRMAGDANVAAISGGGGGSEYEVLATASDVDVAAEGGAEFSLTVPRSGLSAGSSVLIEASVLDTSTGERQNNTATLSVVYEGSDLNAHVETVDGSDVFKPGLPTTFRIKLRKPDGGLAASDVLASGGELTLVVDRNLVSWEATAPAPLRLALSATELAGGAEEVQVFLPKDDPKCCDPLANAETYEDYLEKMGCCTSTVNAHIERGEEWLYGGNDPDMIHNLCLARAYAPTGDFLAVTPPSGESATAIIHSTVAFSDLSDTASYMVIQGGSLAGGGEAAFANPRFVDNLFWEAELVVQIPSGAMGKIKLVAVARKLSDTLAVTGSASFSRSLAWPFTLKAGFSAEEVLPGSGVSLELSTEGASNAHVFVASLDRSAELLRPRAAIGADSVLAGLARAASSPLTMEQRVWRECQVHGGDVSILSELDGSVALLAQSGATDGNDDQDAEEPPKESTDDPWGPALGQNCPRPVSNGCSGGGGGDVIALGGGILERADVDESAAPTDGDVGGAPSRSMAVRKFFPETWVWQDFSLIDAGNTSLNVSLTAPDTITTWTLEAFATTPDGIAAVRSDTPLRVFKPFFVEIRLPYSAVRGEELEVVFAVYNYKEGSNSLEANLEVTLPAGLDLAGGELQQVVTVTEGSAASASIRVRPTALGTVRLLAHVSSSSGTTSLNDAVERAVLVRPEGFEVRETKNLVVELTSESPESTEQIELEVPSEAVEGSARGSLSVTGDLLGPTISGLERLLQIPTGCGEQNMIGLAPNVYVGKYLTAVGRFRSDLRQRISRNLLVGYGRELTYRHPDGSFSAFGTQDTEGSTWLTAFVLKTFAEVHALGLISVDIAVLESAAAWLVAQQAGDGSFIARGKVIHQEMMGGLGSGHGHGSTSSTSPEESALTSYVTAALAKALTEAPSLQVEGLEDALQSAKTYLEGATGAKRAYTKLLRIHALFAAGLLGAAEAASEALALSESAGMLRHWTGSLSTAQDVELTGYGVLLLSLTEHTGEAFQGARWLLKQRKASGGFHSTQDTIIALSALATYASTVMGSVDVTVSVSAAGNLSTTMAVSAGNIDVLQSVSLPQPGAPVSVEASGSGTVLVVAEVVYNLPVQPLPPCYEVDVHWFGIEENPAGGAVRGCAMPMSSCSLGNENGMWILSLGLFTGYGATRQSLEARRLEGAIKRYELGDSRVDLYLEEMVGDRKTCIEFNVTREHNVQSLQAATSEVFEYYAPERRGSVATSFALEEYVAPDDDDTTTSRTVAASVCPILKCSMVVLTLLAQVIA